MKIDISRGINTVTNPINTPEGSYRDAENMRISGGSKRSEEGNLKMSNTPSNLVQWGNCSIGDDTVILGTISGKSVIGVLNSSDVWTLLVPARVGVDVLGITEPTQVVGKKNWAGERVIYFSTKSGSRRINLDKSLPTDDTEFDKITSLFLEYDLPKTSFIGEQTTGNVATGVYQLGARLVTESGATTPFGIISNVIPVVQSSLQSPRGSVEGAAPQTATSKSLEVHITNIDTSFKYIELGILTYVGLANTPVLTVSNQIPINSQSAIKYTYRGAQDDAGTLSIDEFIASGISYLTGKYLTQKDGALIMAAPTEASQPNIDWYRVASNIVSEFTIKKIHYAEKLEFEYKDMDDMDAYDLKETSVERMDDGYKNPITCALYKGYRRNEVYAFTLTPVFVNGVYGPTVHIPAQHSTATEAVNANVNKDLGGTLGTYISEEKYVNDTYPGITSTDGIRLHKFPSAIDQPIISGNVETNDMYIRVLGVKFSNIVLDPSEMEFSSQIAGFIIGRVNRTGNETQLAQGIVRSHIGTQYREQSGKSTLLGDGFVSWKTELKKTGGGHYEHISTGTPDLTSFNFLAPDIIHNLYNPNEGSHIKQHSVYKANPYPSAGFNFNIKDRTDRSGFTSSKTFFKNITGESSQVIDTTEIELDGLSVEVRPFGVPLAPNALGGKVETSIPKGSDVITMCSSDGFVWLGTLNKIPIKYHKDFTYLYRSEQFIYDESSGQRMIALYPSSTRVNFVLHSLVKKNTKQYGPLDQMVSMFVDYVQWKNFAGEVTFFNGDTFINKYGLTVNDEPNYPFSTDDDAENPHYQGFTKPPNASGIIYFWLESNNNYAYRHYIHPTAYSEANVDSVNGSTPFFPAYKQLISAKQPFGLLSMHGENWTRPGYASQYNTQYSAQPTFKPYVITPKEDTERKSSLVNRIIYSDTAVQGEKSDAYQIFLPNNYYDVPQEYGELTDIYVAGELFASTNQVQWKLFFNTLATQATNVGEVVLGTGGAFPRPAVPLTTVDGGFGGTSHWTHAVNTVQGRVFVDKLQGKFFLLQEGLAVFSGELSDTYRLSIQKLKDTDIIVGSEPLRERVFLKLKDDLWSFNLEQKVFVSRHTYKPRWLFSHGSFMYSNNADTSLGTTGIFKHSVGPTGTYYGKLHPASITIVANVENTMSKQFNNLELITHRSKEDGSNLPFTTFNQMEVWNDERYTGLLTITPKTNAFQIPKILEVLASKVKDSFRITISRDIVINPNSNIFTVSNHAQRKGDTTLAKWLPKMKGTYIQIKLITDNTQGPISLHNVLVELSENIR